MRIGKPKSGGKTNFKMEDGDNVYRILPPLGELASEGIWKKYLPIVWGYKGTDNNKKPFVDPSQKNRSNGQWEVMSAALKRRMELEIKQKQMKEAGATPEQMKKMQEIMMNFNIDKKFYVCAVDLKGVVGILKIGYKAMKALDGDKKTADPGLLKKLAKLDPTFNLTGAYINFHRAGKGFETNYTVTPYQVDQGDGSFRIKTHTIDEDFYKASVGPVEKSLNLLNLFPEPTVAEIEEIVNGGPEAVDRILGKPSTVVEAAQPQEVQAPAAPVMQSFSSPEPVAPVVAPEAPVDVAAALADLKATAGVSPEPVAPVAPAPVAPPVAPKSAAEMDPDEFLKSMGVDKV